MHFHPDDRVSLFIDGYHIYTVAKSLGGDLDYRELYKYFLNRCYLVRAYYFGISIDDADYVATRPLTDWLQYNGFAVHMRSARSSADSLSLFRERSRLDVDMAVQILNASEYLDHIVLITGDDAFIPVATALKSKGKIVTLISTLQAEGHAVSDQLRRVCDCFVELASLPNVLTFRLPSSGSGSGDPPEKRKRSDKSTV